VQKSLSGCCNIQEHNYIALYCLNSARFLADWYQFNLYFRLCVCLSNVGFIVAKCLNIESVFGARVTIEHSYYLY